MKFLILIAGLGGFLYGVDFGVIAAAEPYMKALGVYSEGQISQIVGAVLLGGILASLTAGVLADWLGRKRMIVASAAMFLAAIPIVSLSLDSFYVLYAGRVLQGMSAGYMAVIMPMYLTETLPADIRGRGTGVKAGLVDDLGLRGNSHDSLLGIEMERALPRAVTVK